MAEIDRLDVKVEAQATKVNDALETLVGKLERISGALKGINTDSLSRFAERVDNIAQSTAGLYSQISKAGNASKTMHNSLNTYTSTANRATRSTNSLSSAFGKFYANYFMVVRGLKILWSSIQSTADYIEAYNYFDVSFGKISSEWSEDFSKYGYDNADAYAKSFTGRMNETLGKLSGVQLDTENGVLAESGMKNLGLNVKEITQYASQLASITNSVGLTGEASLAASSSFTRLAGDISSLFNIDYSSASKNLQSGLIGQSRALYKYGIDITNATLQTYAYNFGLNKAVSEMTQAEKMQLRMIAILDQSKVAWGDLANTIDSPSNMMRQFTNNLKETGMVLGQLFIPLLKKVLPVINGVTIAIKRLITNIAGVLGVKLDLSSFGQGYTEIEDGAEAIADSFDDATKSAEKFKAVTLGFDELNILNNQSSTSNGSSTGGNSIDLTDEILKATEEYDKIWNEAYNKMESRAQEFADKIEKYLEPVKNLFHDIKIGDWFAVGEDVSNIVSGIFNFFSDAISNVDWYGIGQNIGLFLAGINWTEILGSIGELIWKVINASIDQWKGMFDAAPIETTIITGILLLKWTGLGKILWSNIVSSIAKHISFSSIGTVLSAGIKGLFGSKAAISALAFMDKIAVSFTGIVSIIGGSVLAVSNFIDMWKNGWSVISEIFKDIGIALTAVGAVILGICTGPVAAIVAAIVAAVSTIVILVHDNWNAICDWFSGVAEWFNTNVIIPVADFFRGLWESISGFFKQSWEDTKAIWSIVSTWFSENVIEPVVGFFQGLWTRVKQIFEGLWIIIQAVWKIVSTWFNDNVIVPVVVFFKGLWEKVSGFFKQLWSDIKAIWSIVSSWFNEKIIIPVTGFFKGLWEKVSGFFSKLWSDIKGVWQSVSNWFNNTIINPVKSAFGKACDAIGGFFSGLWKGIKNGVSSAMNAVIGAIESAINWIVKGINNILRGFNKVVSWAADVIGKDWGGVTLINEVHLNRINAYKNGGFPNTGEVFMARENGINELVGRIGNRSAVVNNDQIVASVASGVADAVADVMMAFMGRQRTEEPIVDVTVKADSETLYRTVQKGKQKADRRYHVVTEF